MFLFFENDLPDMVWYRFITLFLLSIGATALMAQETTFEVVTKRVEETFPYRPGFDLNIEGEKADVVIQAAEAQEIGVVMEIVARHPDRAVAERDMEAMKFQVERVEERIFLRNYLSPDDSAPKPESTFDIRYVITVPPDCPVYLKNEYGQANIADLSNQLRVNSSFTRLGLQNLQGMIDIFTRFGDLQGQTINGQVSINARRSNLDLADISGEFDITAQYGILNINADPRLLKLRLDAERSEVFLISPDPRLFAYDLEAHNSEVRLPSNMAFEWKSNDEALKKATFTPTQEFYPSFTITIRFSELTVR